MKKNIHVVEDNEDIREVVEFLLREEGYNFFGYDSAKAFHSRETDSQVDMFVLDVMLPDGNGLDICTELKKDGLTKMVPIMIMSAHMDPATMGSSCPAEEYIKKPFDIDDFISRISRWTKFKN